MIEKNKKILIIGSGALGTALANILIDSGQKNVLIYGINETELNDLEKGLNLAYFDKESKIAKMKTCNDLKLALEDVKYIVFALPSLVIPNVIEDIKKDLKSEDVLIISGSKGFWPNSEFGLHMGIEKAFKDVKNIKGIVSILGPSYAEEMINRSLTNVCAVSRDDGLAREVQLLFSNSYYKIYRQTDVIGAQVGAIYKNILAIGAGILHGKGFKINTIAAYITRGLHEMSILNEYLGGQATTIMGLSGLGDLILTAMSKLSRNRNFGIDFVKNKKKAMSSNITLEGLYALKIVENIRKENNLILPIVSGLYAIIYDNRPIDEAIEILWDRKLNTEN